MEESGKINLLDGEREIVATAQTEGREFETLYNFYFPKIYGYIFARVGSREIAEDLVSQTFLKVFSNLKKYTYQGHSFGAWVYKIATNSLIDHYRRQSRFKETELENAYDLACPEASAQAMAEARETRENVKIVLNQLPDRYQEILHLRFFAELSSQEIAEILGLSANNCRVLTFRALKNFKEYYDKFFQK